MVLKFCNISLSVTTIPQWTKCRFILCQNDLEALVLILSNTVVIYYLMSHLLKLLFRIV